MKTKNRRNTIENINLEVGKKFWDWIIFKEIIKKSIPTILASMLISFTPLVDNIFAGFIDEKAIAAVNYGNTIQFFFLVVIFGAYGAVGVVLAQYYGAKKLEHAREAHKLKIAFAFCLWVICFFVLFFSSGFWLSFFTTDQEIINQGTQFMKIFSIVLLFFWITQAYSSTISQLGRTRVVLLASMWSVGFNAFLDWLFVGYFKFGVQGLAYATLTTVISVCIFYFIYVRATGLFIAFNWFKLFKIHWEVITKTWQRWHMIIVEISFSLGIIVLNIFMARAYDGNNGQIFGVINGMVGIFISLMMSSFAGLYSTVAFFCGKYLGANLKNEAYQNAKRIYVIAFSLGLTLSIILSALAPIYVNGIFGRSVSEANRYEAIMLLRFFPIILPSFIVGVLSFRILEAGGQSKVVMLFDNFHTWLIIVLIGFLIFNVWKPHHFWVGYVISYLTRYVRAVVSSILVQQKLWLINLVKDLAIEPKGFTYGVVMVSTFGTYPLFQKWSKSKNSTLNN